MKLTLQGILKRVYCGYYIIMILGTLAVLLLDTHLTEIDLVLRISSIGLTILYIISLVATLRNMHSLPYRLLLPLVIWHSILFLIVGLRNTYYYGFTLYGILDDLHSLLVSFTAIYLRYSMHKYLVHLGGMVRAEAKEGKDAKLD